MSRNISELLVDPIFHEALGGNFVDGIDPRHLRNLADIAVMAYEEGVIDDQSTLPTVTYSLPWNKQVEASVTIDRGTLDSITLKDRDYAQHLLSSRSQPILSARRILLNNDGQRGLIVLNEPVNTKGSSRRVSSLGGYTPEKKPNKIAMDLAEDARRFFVNHQTFRLFVSTNMPETPNPTLV